MRLVLTNDDGVDSPGIHALAATCAELGHDVLVLAPSTDLSGASAAVGRIEPDQRLELRPVELPGAAAAVEAYALDGPPGLAALVACQGGAGETPDLVLSGINGGPNTGHSILHSGTVGGALTAANFGVSALAVSLDVADPMPWETASALVGGVALYLLTHVAFKLRVLGVLGVHRLVAALGLLAFVPLAHRLEPLVTMGVVATVLWLTFALEAIRHGDDRRAIRHAEHLRHSGD